MLHTPLSEAEAKKDFESNSSNFKAGKCPFEVVEVTEETKTKDTKTYQQFILKLRSYDDDNNTRILMDWIPEYLKWKLRQFYVSIGRLDLYDKERLDPEILIGASGDLDCFYKDVKKDGVSNTYLNVKQYLEPSEDKKPVEEDDLDDDLPF